MNKNPLAEEVRVCNTCNEPKSILDFYASERNRGGREPRCKACRILDVKTSSKRQEQQWKSFLKTQYSIAPEDYYSMLEAQNGVCAICLEPPNQGRLCVDHDHSCCSGKKSCGDCVRGLLCRHCNVALGALKDNIDAVRRSIVYLMEGKQIEQK